MQHDNQIEKIKRTQKTIKAEMGFDFLNNINPFISPNPYPSSRIKKQAKRKTSPPFFFCYVTRKKPIVGRKDSSESDSLTC